MGLWLAAGVAMGGADPYAELLTYDYGQTTAPLRTIEAQIRAATPAQYGPLEDKLLAVLQAPGTKYAGRKFACEMLFRCGSMKCLPALAALLTDEKLANMARFALERLPYPQADVILRDALGRVHGNLKIGIVSSIGGRGDRQAVAALAPLASDKDVKLAAAAMTALGRIGGTEAAGALQRVEPPASLQTCRDENLMLCAAGMCATQPAESAAIYRVVYASARTMPVRVAALRGLAQADPRESVPSVAEAAKGKEARLSMSAIQLLGEIPGPDATQAMTALLPTLPPAGQVVVLNMLANKADRSAAAAVAAMAGSGDPAVGRAALLALGRVGVPANIPLLLAEAAGKGDKADAARRSLTMLNAPGCEEALLAALDKADPAQAGLLVGVLAERRTFAAMPVLLNIVARSADKSLRGETIKAAGMLGRLEDMPAMVSFMLKTGEPAERAGLARAIVAVGLRQGDRDRRVEPILAAMPSAAPDGRADLLRMTGNLGGAKALASIKQAMQSSDAQLNDAAVRALVEWPDDAVAGDLLKLAREGRTPAHRLLALRGYIRLASLAAENRDASGAIQFLQTARPLCQRPEEKRILLGALSDVRSSVPALNLAVTFLGDPAVSDDAAATAVSIAKSFGRKNHEAVAGAMKQVLAVCKDEDICNDARKMAGKKGKGAK